MNSTPATPAQRLATETWNGLLPGSLLLFFSYGIAFMATSSLHELGHVAVHLVKGSPITRFVLHPFLMPHVSTVSGRESLVNWVAGTLLVLVVIVLIGFFGWKTRSSATFPLLVAIPLGLVYEGFNLATAPISPGSDFYLVMAATGLPAALFLILGLAAIVGGIFLFLPLFPLLGIAPQNGRARIFAVLLPGFLTYNILLFGYTRLFAAAAESSVPLEILHYRARNFLVMGAILALITALLYSTWYRAAYPKLPPAWASPTGRVSWQNLLLPGLIFAILLVLGLGFFN